MFGRRRIGPLLKRADAARRKGDWRGAAALFEAILAVRPDDAAIWKQLGHAAREHGDADRADAAYARALAIDPRNADTLVMRGHLRKARGDRAGAIAAYAEAVRIDPDAEAARNELIWMGARDALPRLAYDLDRRGRADAAVAVAMRDLGRAMTMRAAVSTFPVSAYAEFRAVYPIAPPPPGRAACPIGVVVDARGAAPGYLRATLISLLDQTVADWRATIVGGDAFDTHPVASLWRADDRIAVADDRARVPPGWTLSTVAGVVLDPQALAWFAFAAARTEADAIVCDHDLLLDDAYAGRLHGSPVFEGVADRDVVLATARPPVALFARTAEADIRAALLRLIGTGRVAHVPRVLASVLTIPDRAACAPPQPDTVVADRAVADDVPALGSRAGTIEIAERRGRRVALSHPAGDDGRILVVIPTRDQPAFLREAVLSLVDRADDPRRLRIVVMDNRSVGEETAAVLRTLAADAMVEVRRHDEPFNWSRVNNLAAAGARETAIVFVNDDTRMLSAGWDRILLGALERPDVGVVGARLLYPDHTLQHGGVLLGIEGSPRHEGVGAAEGDGGPGGRWRAARAASAVTGAFMAVERTLFEAVGGFDEQRLAVGYNDVDLCLRARAHGAIVLYQPAIELLHYESKTRGLNVGRDRVAWDQGELRSLRDKWGDALDHDPGYNPHWTRGPVAFDGVREPPTSEILAWIDASAARDPWIVEPAR